VITTAVELNNMLSSNTPPQRPVLIQGGLGGGNTQHEHGDGDNSQHDGRNTHLNDTVAATKVDDGTAWLRSVIEACGDEAVVAGVIAYPNVYGRRRRIPVVEPPLDRDQSPNDQPTSTLLPVHRSVPLALPLDVATTLRGFVNEWCQSPSTSNVADDYAATTAAAIVSVRPSPLVFQTAGTCIQRRMNSTIPPFLKGVIAPKAGERGEEARGGKVGSRYNTASAHAPILHSGPVQFSLGGRGSGSQWHHHRAGMKR
jgi:hypothetical protein